MDCSCPRSNGMNRCPNRPITAPDCIGGLVRFLKKRKPDVYEMSMAMIILRALSLMLCILMLRQERIKIRMVRDEKGAVCFSPSTI